MENVAPFADMPITVSLQSLTALKYRTLNCLECGKPYMERNKDQMFVGSQELRINSDGTYHSSCPVCTQKYEVYISTSYSTTTSSLPLYLQPQSIYFVPSAAKSFRDLHCQECGKIFYSFSDRIKSIVDNITPFEHIEPEQMGPMEARCKSRYCSQRWHIRV